MNKVAPTLLALMTTLTAFAATRLTADQTARIDALFEIFAQPDAPGASVMVIHRGKPVFAKGYGLADLQTRVPCSTNTNFRLASVTKQFTAMAVLILAERKKLSLDERLTDFFPEFPDYGRQIAVRHLLTHTSGLIDYEDEIPKGTTLPVLDRDVLRILLKQDKTYFPPGTQYRYSNSGYALLALIVAQRSGQTFARFLKQNIFAPLKMTHTLAYEQGLSAVPNRACGHSPQGDAFKRTDQSLTSSVLGDGGVYSSVADLFKWDQALYTTKLVSQKTLKLAFSPATPTDKPGRDYGLGWFIGEYRRLKEIWHSGETIGFRTRIARFPEQRFSVIILANRSDVKLDELPHRIADLILFGP
jgi:CubicO group peptidase (beta-lactamase class C family)